MKHSAGRKERRRLIHSNRVKEAEKKQQDNDRKFRSLSGGRLYR